MQQNILTKLNKTTEVDQEIIKYDLPFINKALPLITDKKVKSVLDNVEAGNKACNLLDKPLFHSFPARMTLSLAEYLISNLTTQSMTILDPMMGSGTTIIAAKRTGRSAFGFDLDPLAVNLSSAMIAEHDLEDLRTMHRDISIKAKNFNKNISKLDQYYAKKFNEDAQKFIQYWFPAKSIYQLLSLKKAIEGLDKEKQTFFWVLFSSLIIAKESGASYALDLAHSRPHKKLDKKITLPFDTWDSKFNKALKNISANSTSKTIDISLSVGDARSISLPDSSVDLILTSPPYLQAIDYMRCHKFSLIWMGHDISDLRNIRTTAIGAEHALKEAKIPDILNQRLSTLIEKTKKQGWVRRYIEDMLLSMYQMKRVLRPNGIALLTVGPHVIDSKNPDAEEVFGIMAEHVGFTQIGSATREIANSRRTLPPPVLVDKNNTFHKRYQQEYIIALRNQ